MIRYNSIIQLSDGITNEDKQNFIESLNVSHDEIDKLNLINCTIDKISDTFIKMRFEFYSVNKTFIFNIKSDSKNNIKVTVGEYNRKHYYVKLENSTLEVGLRLCKAIIVNINKNLLLETQNNIL
jgi:hypothetical protein